MTLTPQKIIPVGIILGFGLYTLFAFSSILSGVRLEVYGLQTQTSPHSKYLEITGKTKRATSLTINDFSIPVRDDGEFMYPLLLPSGYSVVTVTATDRFDKSKTAVFEFYTN